MSDHVHSFRPVQLMNPLPSGGTNAWYQQALVICPSCGATKVVVLEHS